VLIDRFGRHPDAGGAHRVEDLGGLLELVG
jgi:hypothetical protein